jgi:hypothetical protein
MFTLVNTDRLLELADGLPGSANVARDVRIAAAHVSGGRRADAAGKFHDARHIVLGVVCALECNGRPDDAEDRTELASTPLRKARLLMRALHAAEKAMGETSDVLVVTGRRG